MKLGKCKVFIKCDGSNVREFNPVVHDGGRKVSCWIASEPGKVFQIEYRRSLDYDPQNTELTADVYLDGKLSGAWLAPDPKPQAREVFGEIVGSRRGNKVHNFVFSNPEIIEEETPSSVNPDHIGEIWVALGLTNKSECTRVGVEQILVDPNPTRVNEKDKKPGAHCVTLKKSSEKCTGSVFFCEELEEHPLVFMFQCRGEEWLQAEGVMRKPRRKRGELEPAEGSPGPKMKVEEPSSALGIKEEAGEVKIEDLEAEDEQIPRPEKKRAKVRGEIATFQAPRTGSKARFPRVKVKAERE